jgi:hypothetical protein
MSVFLAAAANAATPTEIAEVKGAITGAEEVAECLHLHETRGNFTKGQVEACIRAVIAVNNGALQASR